MPPPLLVDLATVDFNHVEAGREVLNTFLQQRFEMEQLDAVVKYDRETKIAVGYKDVRTDEFWVRGHIPGRPLMPGVIMIEAAAQLSTYWIKRALGDDPGRFIGFAGLEHVRFRGTVLPGDRLILLSKNTDLRARTSRCQAQGVVNGKLVFEGEILGMAV
ncbi:MAG: beta-hydroxyacyl-ACP dehydratase [Planctomycetes bacterium]|nr:beta-hydroxyacyl-ACP dehydratase [Planctomycetota bacterium]